MDFICGYLFRSLMIQRSPFLIYFLPSYYRGMRSESLQDLQAHQLRFFVGIFLFPPTSSIEETVMVFKTSHFAKAESNMCCKESGIMMLCNLLHDTKA